MRPHAAVLLLLLVATSAQADISPVREFGQTLTPGRETAVAMTAEEVSVTLLRDRALVRAVFHLENTGAATELVVGFPGTANDGRYAATTRNRTAANARLREFRARVDGVRVEHRGLRPPAPDLTESPAEKPPFQYWILFDMDFEAGGKRTVEVEYWVPYRPKYRSTLLKAWDFDYILVTGARWAGSIGKAVIDVRCGGGLTPEHLDGFKPGGFEKTEHGVRWELTDLEPTEDVQIEVRRLANHTAGAKHYLEIAEAKEGEKPYEAAQARAAAAMCLREIGETEACLAQVRKVLAFETAARDGGAPKRQHYVTRSYRAPEVLWECWRVRLLVKLGRVDEARGDAEAAILRLRTSLAQAKRYRYPTVEKIEARIARYEAFAEGGEFED